jgi:hypothetical protein
MKRISDITGTEAEESVGLRLVGILNREPIEGDAVVDPITMTYYTFIGDKWLVLVVL